MSVSKEWIRNRLYSGKKNGYSHMVVICDSWDYTDFVIFIKEEENIDDKLKDYVGLNTLYRIMEIYNYSIDLEYQLNEYRTMHKEVSITTKKEERKLDRLEKLPNYEHSYSAGKIKINLFGYIPFEEMKNIPNDMNGYIDKDGNFFPAISIASTNYCYNNLKNISIEQFAEAFIQKYVSDITTLNEYNQLIINQPDRKILEIADNFIINNLGFAKFYRYIDASEYGSTDERSQLPENPSVYQLILMQHLFNINHNGSTNIINKSIQYSLQLAKNLKG